MKKAKRKYFGEKCTWQRGAYLGSGGNAIVYECQGDNEDTLFAIKIFKTKKNGFDKKRYERFKKEIETIRSVQDKYDQILRVIDYKTPKIPSFNDPAFYVMPLAIPIKKWLKGKVYKEKLRAMFDYTKLLSDLYENDGISHRDIKPANLFFCDGKFCVADFGLVKNVAEKGLSSDGEKIGSAHYIAPEMLNNANESDGSKADVYSLAKTLWVLLSGQNYPIPGEYNIDSLYRLSNYLKMDNETSESIDGLMAWATKENIDERLTIVKFKDELQQVLTKKSQSSPPSLTSIIKSIQNRATKDAKEVDQYYQRANDSKSMVNKVAVYLEPIHKEIQDNIIGIQNIELSQPVENQTIFDYFFSMEHTQSGAVKNFGDSCCLVLSNKSLSNHQKLFWGIAWSLYINGDIKLASAIMVGPTTNDLEFLYKSKVEKTKFGLPSVENNLQQLANELSDNSAKSLEEFYKRL